MLTVEAFQGVLIVPVPVWTVRTTTIASHNAKNRLNAEVPEKVSLSNVIFYFCAILLTRTCTVVVYFYYSLAQVEVCGFKDCRRSGGGARLEILVREVSRLQYVVILRGIFRFLVFTSDLSSNRSLFPGHRRKLSTDHGRRVRLSGRMRLRTQDSDRRKDCQWSARSRGRFAGNVHSTGVVNICCVVLLTALLFLSLLAGKVECFVCNAGGELSPRHHRWSNSDGNLHNHVLSVLKEEEAEGEFGEDLDTGSVLIEDLSWRVEKLRLEEQNRERFLKSKPRFLPYEECRKWVQAFGRWKTEEDWKEWISMGEKRNSYIPVSESKF